MEYTFLLHGLELRDEHQAKCMMTIDTCDVPSH